MSINVSQEETNRQGEIVPDNNLISSCEPKQKLTTDLEELPTKCLLALENAYYKAQFWSSN